ncbi:MAG: helix-turn-helix domain-containing protein [Halieaceae bacterium]|nr:helix-turn-helix domain-containing protein [Halieaceae bacterium]
MSESAKRPALADLIDLLGTKWVMRILWELRENALTFRALQAACGGLSPSVLNHRLKLLETSRLVERQQSGYGLTDQGQSLMEVQKPLAQWAQRWQRSLT